MHSASSRQPRGLRRRVGSAQLVLGRALLEQSRLDEAEAAFASASPAYDQLRRRVIAQPPGSHRATSRRGAATTGCSHLYRSAAEALQDVRF